MVFSNLLFIFWFFPLVLGFYFLACDQYRNIILLFFSLLFYAWGEPQYVFLMLLSIFINYFFGLSLANTRRPQMVLTLAIIINLSILLYYKYAAFIVQILNSLGLSFSIKQLPLPVGISFFTFHAMSYLIDVYKKKVSPQRNILDLALYFTVFPQMVAGPIVRYNTISHQLHQRTVTIDSFAYGLKRFIIGLAKKVLIANQLGLVADEIFQASPTSTAAAWIGILAYTLQIYFDFSGYSDMAIGLAKCFGFDFLENFNYPYISRSISEFWRRWHISLGSWFRDYVYIPLGGNRVSEGKIYLNLFIVWMLTGLWHGASWTFVAWGIYYGILIMFEKAGLSTILERLPKIFQHSYVLLLVMIGWVFFRADSFSYSKIYLQTMFGAGPLFDTKVGLYVHDYWYIFCIALIGATPIFPWFMNKINARFGFTFPEAVYYAILFVTSILYLVTATYNPFIYFRF
ncbi:MBOAT family protein [Bacillus sp. 165]|uniref:MBOAT family O-acyltransferase n=1 Tax=Bacillus sp. 165 TaxID=1529117 RepID=UPI001ADA1AE2|nr:MBOAT family protein [Bacillus sp. 165]MBO9131525.1 MBOAT family protein [Bacillus sp. 165]